MAGEKPADAGTTETEPAKAGEPGSSQSSSLTPLVAPKEGSFADLVAKAKAANPPVDTLRPKEGAGVAEEVVPDGTEPAAEGKDGNGGDEPTPDAQPAEGQPEPEEPEETDEKGRVVLRPNRWKKLLEKAKGYDDLTGKLAEMALEDRSGGEGEEPEVPPAKPPPPPAKPDEAIAKRIKDAQEKLKKAKTDFDVDAEIAAIDELTEAKADLKAGQIRAETRKDNQVSEWNGRLQAAEFQHKDARDKAFVEDQGRFPDLKNAKSSLFQEVRRILGGWQASEDPVALAPNAERLAVEQAASRLGLNIPPVTPAVTPTPKPQPKPSAPGGGKATARAGQAAIHGASTGTPPVNQAEVLKQFESLPFQKKLQVLKSLRK